MASAQSDEHSDLGKYRPCALFLTEGHHLPAAAFQLLDVAYQVGFDVFAVPWFSVRSTRCGTFVTAGLRLAGTQTTAVTDWVQIRPRFLVPLFPIDSVTRAALRSLAHSCPEAVVAFHPKLEIRAPAFATSKLRAIPALFQTRPQTLRLHMKMGRGHDRVAALLNDWWRRHVKDLVGTPLFYRLLLPINLYIDRSRGEFDFNLRGIDFLPYGGGLGTDNSYWSKRTYSLLNLAYERTYEPPNVRLPEPRRSFSHDAEPLVFPANRRPRRRRLALLSESSLSGERDRLELRCGLMAALREGEGCTVKGCFSGAYRGISVRARRTDRQVTLDFTFERGASLSHVSHPLSSLLPALDSGHCYVDTCARSDANFAFVDPRLKGPKFGVQCPDTKAVLLKYLGRTIREGNNASSDPFGLRYIEPGIGRGYLVDFLRVDGRPELSDFSVIGVGLTPYTRGGYIDVGRAIDGKITMGRALHRKLCADRLEEAGCRTAPVVAVIHLKNDHVKLPTGDLAQSALVVRGFRSVLRIRQLDPVACLYHSFRARPKLVAFLNEARWSRSDEGRLQAAQIRDRDLFRGTSDRYGVLGVLPRLAAVDHLDTSNPQVQALQRRYRATRMYAPFLIDIVKMRLAIELGRDPLNEPLTNLEYAQWFAATVGRQLAVFRQKRFLHDYHQDGISFSNRLSPLLYSLGENNITLMAEFPDLDTGVFVDTPGESSVEELRLTRGDLALLSSNFERFHRRDLRLAKSAVCTLVTIVCHGQSAAIEPALHCFESEYFLRAYSRRP